MIKQPQKRKSSVKLPRTENTKFIEVHDPQAPVAESTLEYPQRLHLNIQNGSLLIGSDGHYIPGQPPATAHRAFVKFCKETPDLKTICYNGDSADFSILSRFGRRMFEKQDLIVKELEIVNERLDEIEAVMPYRKPLFHTIGNHCVLRFGNFLSKNAGCLEGVQGFRFADHISPRWQICWSLWINGGELVIKHRFKGGTHAVHNATMWSGKDIVQSHLHSLKCIPFNDCNGLRFGVDGGMLGDPMSSAFNYGEDNPRNHRAGFVLITFKDGKMLAPEPVHVWSKKQFQNVFAMMLECEHCRLRRENWKLRCQRLI